MPTVFVVKAIEEGQPVPGVFDELKAGRARMGWSYQDNLDLRLLLGRIEQGEQLDEDERGAKRCLGFLTRVKLEDYLLYPHQPERGLFSVVQVKGDYKYSTDKDGLTTASGRDFRSLRACSLKTPDPVDMYDEIVPSQLRQRLGRPGRISQVYDTSSFFGFLEDLPNRGQLQDGSNRASLRRIHNGLRENLPDALRREFGRADLSRRFCPDLFERMGYSAEVQEGPAEAGSDVVVTVGNPLLPDDGFRIGVQAFAYEETVEEWALQDKLEQLLGGWEDNSLDYGVLFTTGRCSEAAVAALHKHNKEKPDRLVRLIEGDELADLFLKHFPPGDLGPGALIA